MGRYIDIDQITIPRWTIREEPQMADCPGCRTATVRVGVDRRAYIFCGCQLLIELLPGR
jgi:hypothetical protein